MHSKPTYNEMNIIRGIFGNSEQNKQLNEMYAPPTGGVTGTPNTPPMPYSERAGEGEPQLPPTYPDPNPEVPQPGRKGQGGPGGGPGTDPFRRAGTGTGAPGGKNPTGGERAPNGKKDKAGRPRAGSIAEAYYTHLSQRLNEQLETNLEKVSAKRRERQVEVAGLKGEINPHGFVDLVQGMKNLRTFSGMGGGDMPKDRVEKPSENIGERTVAKADQRKALMAIMSASQDHPDLKDRFTKEDALNPHSPLHKMLVSRNPNLRDESQIMAKYHV
jgi:hypothetical protein